MSAEIGMAQPVIEAAKGIRQQCANCGGMVLWHNVEHRWVHTPGLKPECASSPVDDWGQPCTTPTAHRADECNGYHLDASDV